MMSWSSNRRTPMNLKITGLSLACGLALAACGDKSPPPASAPDAPASTQAPATGSAAPAAQTPAPDTTPATTPAPDASTPPAADAGAAPADGKPEAVVSNCSTTI